MTMAQKMRELTNKANEQIRLTRVAKHAIYTNDKLVKGIIDRKACKGYSKAVVKLPKKYSACLVMDELRNRGFEVREARVKGKSVLTIQW